MDAFNVGDRVIIRYGQWQGEEGEVVGKQRGGIYDVRLSSGTVLFFSRASLLAAPSAPNRVPEAAWGAPSRN
jgi:hypothetical protein